MKIGIVGSEGAKFTTATERLARIAIRRFLSPGNDISSGGCHLGGINKWTIEEAKARGLATREYPLAYLQWSPSYKERNIQLAAENDKVVCITLRRLPASYGGMTFKGCYHCGTNDHVKSGGCWTMKYAKKLGKQIELIVIDDNMDLT